MTEDEINRAFNNKLPIRWTDIYRRSIDYLFIREIETRSNGDDSDSVSLILEDVCGHSTTKVPAYQCEIIEDYPA